jgi:DNA polymerase III sliding clamp (beta) subunit (PCNA family)
MNLAKQDLQEAFKMLKGFKQAILYYKDGSLYGNNNIVGFKNTVRTDAGEFTIKIDKLDEFLNKIKTETVDISIQRENVTFKAGKYSVDIPMLSMQKDYFVFDDDITEWNELPVDFVQAIEKTYFCVAKPDSRKFMSSIKIDNDKAVATNGQRLIVYTMKSEMGSLLLEANIIKEIIRYNIRQFAQKDGKVYFRSNNTIFVFTETTGEFPPYQKLMTNEYEFKLKLPPDLLEGINVVSLFAEPDTMIDFEIANRKIKSTSHSATGKVNYTDDIATDENINFKLKPVFLQDILKDANELYIEKEMAYFSTETYYYIFMLGRKV